MKKQTKEQYPYNLSNEELIKRTVESLTPKTVRPETGNLFGGKIHCTCPDCEEEKEKDEYVFTVRETHSDGEVKLERIAHDNLVNQILEDSETEKQLWKQQDKLCWIIVWCLAIFVAGYGLYQFIRFIVEGFTL